MTGARLLRDAYEGEGRRSGSSWRDYRFLAPGLDPGEASSGPRGMNFIRVLADMFTAHQRAFGTNTV